MNYNMLGDTFLSTNMLCTFFHKILKIFGYFLLGNLFKSPFSVLLLHTSVKKCFSSLKKLKIKIQVALAFSKHSV